jgi:glycosyltransferase involved in cell wall biosynthesis
MRYIADLHGLGWVNMRDWIDRKEASPEKDDLLDRFLPQLREKEEEAYRRALCLVCQSEALRERVKHLNRAEVVRDAVDLTRYNPTERSKLRVAVVGPFIEGHQNLYALEVFHEILRLDRETEYVVIGRIDEQHKELISRFDNVTCTGFVDDFVEALRQCSILLCPYPPRSGSAGGAKTKAIEAAACSIPIVGTPDGLGDFGQELVLLGETAGELVERISYLSEENLRRELGRKLRTEVQEKHDIVKESRKLIALYQEFLKQIV